MFVMLSIRLLPRRSGISNVRPSSSTWTKPGLSPLGEQSSPWLLPVARIRNGEAAIKARPTASSWSISFLRTRSDGRA